ncbi:MAG: alpha-2-macroglobulin [Betaproteobacteria bacterium]|nr:alpha-2-macroglobulin [Betaproteobacteria bacterium]
MTAPDRMASKCPRWLKSLLLPFQALRWLIHQLFGELFWRPPRWAAFAGRGVGAASGCARRHPAWLIGILAVLAALIGGWFWWQAQPKPVTVQMQVVNPEYTNYNTDNEKPKVFPLNIVFSAPVAILESVDKEVASESITVSPPLKGKWKWQGDTVLSLMPDPDWPVGTDYTVTFSPKMFRPEARFDSYKATFHSPLFEMRSLTARFDQSPTDPKNKIVVATIDFSHPVDTADFEKRISLVMGGQEKGVLGLGEKKTAFEVSYDKKKLSASIHSTRLPIPEKPQTMRVTIDKGVHAAGGGNATSEAMSATADIPGIDSLRINDLRPIVVTNEKFQPEQVLTLQPSMLVQEREAKNAVKAWLLPEQPPEGAPQRNLRISWDKKKPYPWSDGDVSLIDPTTLEGGEVVKLEAIPSENDVADTFSYRYHATPGRYLYVQIPKGLMAFGGYRLGKDVIRVFKVPDYPAVAKIMSEGSLLSLAGERKLSVLARDIPAIRYTISRVLPQQLQLLVKRNDVRYNNDFFANPNLQNYGYITEDDISERFVKIIELPKLEPGKPQYQALDLNEYLKTQRGIFVLHVQGYDPKTKLPIGEQDNRLIMVSDLGMIDKKASDGSHDLFVQSIHNGGPVANASIDVIGRNGLSVLQVKTDASGHAALPRIDNFKNEREPIFFLASKDGDSSFLPYNPYNSRNLNYSRFDVGGAVNATEAKQLSAYLFSDRGIYRPGEEIRVGMIVRPTDWAQSVAGIPLQLEVIDARGLTVRRDKIKLPESGFGELRHPTLDTAPAGTYTINLSLIKKDRADTVIGSTTVRVQDFEPDRLRMNVHFSDTSNDGWVTPNDLAVQVSLQNLFATPAEDRRIRGFMSLTPGVLKFAHYKDYLFNDPYNDPKHPMETVSEELAETRTDVQGQTTLKLDLQRFARATYRAQVVVQGYEADGGRGVSSEAAVLVSSLDYLVGYKPDGKLEFVRRDSERKVNLLAIGRDGKQRAVDGLKLQRVERRFVSVLTKQDDGTYRYLSKEKEILLDETPLTIAAAGQPLKLATETPGAFSYVVRDKDGLEYAHINYSVAGEANLTRSLDKNAELKLTLSKGDFAPGEEIEVQIEAPYTGSGLITIERDKIYAYRWFSSKTTSTVQKIKLPNDVDGNAYLTITFVRDPGSDEIYMSPLSYGVAPFSISRERYQTKLDVTTPDKIKPGDTVAFKVKSSKPTKAVVFAVDEGILQVARYKMADPLGYFFQKRALEVATSQLLDMILPEFSRVMASAPGGDGEGALGKFLNPFKRKRDPAVAYWSGIVDVGPDGKSLSWQVPESFNGSLRVMAVAVSPQTIGTFEGHTVVRGDFVLSPNAPLSVTPGDEFDLPVGVSNNLEGSGKDAKVKIALDTGDYFEVVGDKAIDVPISENREGIVHFRVRAKPLLGSGTLSLTASIGDKKSRLATAVSVRPATPYRQEFQAGTVAAGKEAELPMSRRLFPDHRKLAVNVSASPMVMADGLAAYLGEYPYSCTEQIVSQAIPALVLSHRPGFGEIKTKRGETLSSLMTTLRARQNAEGAYGLWAANTIISEPASVWAQQFLVEAKDRGEVVPADMLQRGNEWLQDFATSEGDDLFADRLRAQAVYLLTRQGTQTSSLAATIQKRLEKRDAKTWKNDLAAVYLAATYKMLKQDRLADDVLSDFRFNISAEGKKEDERNDPLAGARDNEWWLCADVCRDAGALYLLAKHFPERAKALPGDAFTPMLTALTTYQNTTITSAGLLLALDAWTNLAETSASAKFSVNEILKDKTARELALSEGLVQRASFTPEALKLAIRNQGNLMGFYVAEASGFDVEPPTSDVREGAEILREYTDASGKLLTSVTQGDDVYVHLKFRGLNRTFDGNLMAIVDLLPGGFDLVLNPPNAAANSNDSQQALRADAHNEEAESEGGDDGQDNSSNDEESHWTPPFGNSPTNWWAQYADVREDRIVLYGVLESKSNEFVYKIRATNVGTYTLPPAYAEGLYRRDIRARSLPGGKLTVVPVKK